MNFAAPSNGRATSLRSFVARGLACPLFVLACAPSLCLAGTVAAPLAAEAALAAPTEIDYDVAPSGAWIAVWTKGRGDQVAHAWLVNVNDGSTRSLDEFAFASGSLGWDEQSRLRIQVTERGRGAPEMRWIDVEQSRVVEVTRDRARMKAETSGATWAAIDERKLSDGRRATTITELSSGKKFESSSRNDDGCQVSQLPGIAFVGTTNGPTLELARVEIATGRSKRFAQLDSTIVSWSVSRSGDGVLLVESGSERRARVIDTTSGMLLRGPWVADDARWLDGAEGRFIALTRAGRKYVYDTLRDRELELSSDEGPWPRIEALSDGRFAVASGGRLELFDENLKSSKTLFDATASVAKK